MVDVVNPDEDPMSPEELAAATGGGVEAPELVSAEAPMIIDSVGDTPEAPKLLAP